LEDGEDNRFADDELFEKFAYEFDVAKEAILGF